MGRSDIEFDFNGSGKTAYFAVQIENEGKKMYVGANGIGIDTLTKVFIRKCGYTYKFDGGNRPLA